MSKYGTIKVDVYSVYTKEQLTKFAKKVDITYEKAESLARERLYRKAYMEMRNKAPEVKEKRKEYNQKRYELRKMLG
jgi:hypothetical protein